MPVHHSIVKARTLSELEAWQRLGWQVIAHVYDQAGAVTLLGLLVRRGVNHA